MNCLHSMAPGDEELLNYALDGEALPSEKKEHVAQCAQCQQRLKEYTGINTKLTAHLYRSQCPDGTELSLYCADLLPADERIHVARHVLSCPLCTMEVESTRGFFTQTDLVPAEEFSIMNHVKRVMASLVRQQAQLVLRSEAKKVGWPRQYRADSVDLSLHLSRSRNGEYLLLGILTSVNNKECVDAFEGEKAELYPTGSLNQIENGSVKDPLYSAEVDDLGNVVFSGVPVGEYAMIIHLPEHQVVIEHITIE